MEIKEKKFYTKQDIENFLRTNPQFDAKIYSSVKEMLEVENYDCYEDDTILYFTDGMYNANNYKCYVIKKDIYPDSRVDTNIVFVDYNDNDIPVSSYVDNPWGKIANEVGKMASTSMIYLNNKNKSKK